MQSNEALSVSAALARLIHQAISRNGGWLPFDRFMSMALYAPGLGYYAHGSSKFGSLPQSGSDFVTAPELTSLFGHALGRQISQALLACAGDEVWEFGAGSGALAEQVLESLAAQGVGLRRYTIVEVSASLRDRQCQRLARFGATVQWAAELPAALHGVVIGNEVLDAMPVQLLRFDGKQWLERGVVAQDGLLAWGDRPTILRPPVNADSFAPDFVTEVHPQAEAFISTLADRLTRGAAFFIDYGFPEDEYYHPQRHGGTLMCHRAHRADGDPLVDVGLKDITAHVNFTGIALAAQDAGLSVLGYTSQAHFLLNCGILEILDRRAKDQGGASSDLAQVRATAAVQTLLQEHEMGELFKVIGLTKGCDPAFEANPLGFAKGDRTHRL